MRLNKIVWALGAGKLYYFDNPEETLWGSPMRKMGILTETEVRNGYGNLIPDCDPTPYYMPGDTVYWLYHNDIFQCTITASAYDVRNDGWIYRCRYDDDHVRNFADYQIDRDVFDTYEEAETRAMGYE